MGDSKKQNAINRLEQIKSQLNFAPSSMSLDAPKDMAQERKAASFDIQALTYAWFGGRDQFEKSVSF